MKYLNIFLILLVFVGCVESTNKSENTAPTERNPIVDPPVVVPPVDPPDPGVIDFHKLNSPYITMHGSSYYAEQPNRVGPNNEILMWSSESDLNGISEDIFLTDSRFNMKLIPRNSGASIDSQGNSCDYNWQPFQKLQVEVRIRKKGSAYGYNHVFDNLTIDEESKVKEFTVPLNASGPLVIEVLRVKWDYTCSYYEGQGYPDYPGYCPWDDVWKFDCVALEMQVSTDYTKDIPGDRY